ncbi:MAG TPA: plastocyanin/azurin family copper-binding protein [Vicinamibacteria bacterium]|nr:plastocyanin/azurin family copper-binding protein [Vicinamibacteria bacterium]
MSQRALVAVAVLGLGLCGSAAQAATSVVTLTNVPSNRFTPQGITIRVGDTVQWNNVAGIHNVNSDTPGLFRSGDPAAAPWSYTFTFTTVGTFGYHCEPHGSPGNGMFGTVVVLDSIEMAHGSDMTEDLAGAPDRYRIGQKPYSSYEVVVDALAGNPQLDLRRTDATGTSTIQTGEPVSATIDMSQSLRWQNSSANVVDTERVLVSSGSCPTNCTGNDAYRIRAYESTLAAPRFNQTGSQTSVVILQNPTNYPISGTIFFWNASGGLLNPPGTAFGPLGPKAAFVLSAATVAGLPGTSGTVTIAHTGRYGDLTGKVVALEPSTGFSFDTPAVPRPR